ncbi:hypothetical protein PIB30_060999 [Stylosanthes scabra]|uniref:Uncharacterized protein n=1 Tax=Stylosanthes scabra TaxID=79078 RepID=A0ABU6ZJE8_9FABA|nr:hypothetical protein [Stylosanthes scabra]
MLQRIDSAEARVNSTFEIGLKRVDSSSSESILKEEECHRDDITRFIRIENPWVGDSHSVSISDFSGVGSSLESGEACCNLLRSRLSSGLSYPLRIFRRTRVLWLEFYESELSVCSATVSAELVRGASLVNSEVNQQRGEECLYLGQSTMLTVPASGIGGGASTFWRRSTWIVIGLPTIENRIFTFEASNNHDRNPVEYYVGLDWQRFRNAYGLRTRDSMVFHIVDWIRQIIQIRIIRHRYGA